MRTRIHIPRLNVFLRQCLTETESPKDTHLIQFAFNALQQSANKQHFSVNFLPGKTATTAKWNGNFRQLFTEETGLAFTPAYFEQWRSAQLKTADIFCAIRTNRSESGSYETGWFAAQFTKPWSRIFIIMPEDMTIKTTLLNNATIIKFHPDDFPGLTQKIDRVIFESPVVNDIIATKRNNSYALFQAGETASAPSLESDHSCKIG